MDSKLAASIGQSKPFASLQEEAGLLMARIGNDQRYRFEELLKPSGLNAALYNVLRILRGAGQAGLPCSAIGDRMVVRSPDITRLLDRLAAKGLIARRRDDADRRVVVSQITAVGLDLLAELDAPIDELNRQHFAPLSTEGLRQLVALLDELYRPPKEATPTAPATP